MEKENEEIEPDYDMGEPEGKLVFLWRAQELLDRNRRLVRIASDALKQMPYKPEELAKALYKIATSEY